MSKKRMLMVGAAPQVVARLKAEVDEEELPWELVEASEPKVALEQLKAGPTYALIAHGVTPRSDMRLLLRQVRQEFPTVACLAVCSSSPMETTPAMGAVQIINPGYTAVSLDVSIERSAALQRVISDEAVGKAAGRLDKLPSVPATYLQVCQVAADPDSSINDIARIVQQDPAMSLKVLQLVNSAFFGISRRTTSINEAVSLLGVDQLKGLILASHVFGALEGREPKHFSLEVFQKYSVRVARLARAFVADRRLQEEAFTAGLLHDVGKVVLALRDKDRFERVLLRQAETGEDASVVEQELLGLTHSTVGAYLLSSWEIPFSIVECVAFHHEPSKLRRTAPPILAAVHAVDALVGITACNEPESKLDKGFVEWAGFGPKLPEWRRRVEVECATG